MNRVEWRPPARRSNETTSRSSGCSGNRSPLPSADNRGGQIPFRIDNLCQSLGVQAISGLLYPKMAAAPSRQRASTPSSPLLLTFQRHIEDMRNLVLCKVCIKPLYEPYNLGCGHTYCYSCLANWFGGANKRKRKTCPDCRAQVTAQPAPNYLVRPCPQKLDAFADGGMQASRSRSHVHQPH